MIRYGEKGVKKVLLLIFANIITLYQLSQFYLKSQTTKTPLYHKGSHTLTLKVKRKKQGFLSKGRLVNIKIPRFPRKLRIS